MESNRNFMDCYLSPDEYIRAEICANRGPQNVMQKDTLLYLLEAAHMKADPKATKGELYDQLRKEMTVEEIAARCKHLGVSSRSWQLKFGISNDDVRYMALAGYITVTGKVRFRGWGRMQEAPLYSVFDYFRLSKEDVQQWLLDNPRPEKWWMMRQE